MNSDQQIEILSRYSAALSRHRDGLREDVAFLSALVGAERREYLSVAQAVAYFQGAVSKREIYKLFKSGELPGFRVGAKVLLYRAGLDAYRSAHENKKPPEVPEVSELPLPLPTKPTTRQRGAVPPLRLPRLP